MDKEAVSRKRCNRKLLYLKTHLIRKHPQARKQNMAGNTSREQVDLGDSHSKDSISTRTSRLYSDGSKPHMGYRKRVTAMQADQIEALQVGKTNNK